VIRQGDRMFTFQAWPRVVNECDVKMPGEAAELHAIVCIEKPAEAQKWCPVSLSRRR